MGYYKAFRIRGGKLVSTSPALSYCGNRRIAGWLVYSPGKRTEKIPGSLGIFIWESDSGFGYLPRGVFGDAIYEIKVGPVKQIKLALSTLAHDVPERVFHSILNGEYPEPNYRWMALELERGLVTDWVVPIRLVWLRPGKEIPNESL